LNLRLFSNHSHTEKCKRLLRLLHEGKTEEIKVKFIINNCCKRNIKHLEFTYQFQCVIRSVQIKLRLPSKGSLYVASTVKVESRYFVSLLSHKTLQIEKRVMWMRYSISSSSGPFISSEAAIYLAR